MKSDQLILVYWARGLYYNSRIVEFIHSIQNFLILNTGINIYSLNILLKRLEINKQNFKLKLNLLVFSTQQQYALNNELSAISSTNYPVRMLYRFNILKLFFIRSYKGICHILGKPVHGQRTWSNGWNAFYLNRTVRTYLYKTHGNSIAINQKKVREKSNTVQIKKKLKQDLWI